MSAPRANVAVFAIALVVFGLVALAFVWSGAWAYAALAQATGHTETTVLLADPRGDRGVETRVDLGLLLDWHRGWVAYVTGASADPPRFFGSGPVFTADEYAHMADVRNLFAGAKLAGLLALAVAAVRLYRARRERRALRLVRDGALVAAGIVALAGAASALAFEPLFLLFHEAFFPQGNFLFDPATSNLLRLYPPWYWEGVTAAVAGSFVVLAFVSAGIAQIALRRDSTTYTRAA